MGRNEELLDDLALALAEGVPRREALRLLGGAFAALSFLNPAEAFAAVRKKCPKGRRLCGKKCCPKGFSCHTVRLRGKKVKQCFCAKPRKKCGSRCVDRRTDEANCGACGHRCASGETCTNGTCVKPQTQTNPTPEQPPPDQQPAPSQPACTSDADVPDDGNPCTQNVCRDGVPSHPPVANGTTCNNGKCHDGLCSTCDVAADCGANTECRSYTCSSSGTCGQTFAAAGTLLAAQNAGDCHRNICDGAGGTTVEIDNADAPAGDDCNQGSCVGGVPQTRPKPDGSPCGAGQICVSGTCADCIAPSDCPDPGNECLQRTCNNNTCGTAAAPDGTPVAQQTAGDCQQTVCDGTGGTRLQNDDGDLPADGNDCTDDVCLGGVPSHPPKANGTPCAGGICTAGVCG